MVSTGFFCLLICSFFYYPRQSITRHSVYMLQPICSVFLYFVHKFTNNEEQFVHSYPGDVHLDRAVHVEIKGRHYFLCGPGSVVGIATAYGLDGTGIISRWGEIFRTCPDRP